MKEPNLRCRIIERINTENVSPDEYKLLKETSDALEAAMRIIETVGTTGIEHKHAEADSWLAKYYPERR